MRTRGIRPARPSRRAVLTGAGALAASSALAACGDQSAPIDEEGRVRIRLQLDTSARAEHGGFYQALASGAYARRGLNVELLPGDPAMVLGQSLSAGAVELALAGDSFQALALVAEGAPVKAVAAYFQRDSQVLLAHPAETLETPRDLVGRPIRVPPRARAGVWAWLRAKYGFTDDQLRDPAPLPQGWIEAEAPDLLGSAATDAALIAQNDGPSPRVFDLSEEGYGAYGCLVLAPNGFARDNAQALRNFLAASSEGWRDYIQGDRGAGVQAADALIRRANPAMPQAVLAEARASLRRGGYVDGGDAALYGLGAMTPDRWRTFVDTVSQAGVFEPTLDWRPAFTNQYLPGRG